MQPSQRQGCKPPLTIATPTAPIPVQIAYAVPTGIVSMATASNQKLIVMDETVRREGMSFVNPFVYLRPIAIHTQIVLLLLIKPIPY
jgi:hypothetical protein